MAADTRPYKSKEQDGQGNELIIRDQQLVEQDTTTTMPAGTCFQTLDVDGRPVKIPKANMVDIVREALGSLLNGLADQTTVTKVPSLNGNTLGASTVATLASVLGAIIGVKIVPNDPTRAFGAEDLDGISIELIYEDTTNTYPTTHGICVKFLQSNAGLGGAIYIASDDKFYYARKWISWASWKQLT